jgi:methionyl-tRNA synthetase
MSKPTAPRGRPVMDVPAILARIPRPTRAVVTAGMPYANGPLHIGHLAGAHVPGDIHARWLSLLIGRRSVLFVCGTDDHGSTSDVAAMKAGRSIREFIDGIHALQSQTLQRFDIDLDVYTGTSRPETFSRQTALAHDFLRRLHANGMLLKRTSKQWFDPTLGRFLPDRLVRGTCPNPACGYSDAYGDECSACGHQHEASELLQPRSNLSGEEPEMRDTVHWFLDMDAVSETLREWIEGKQQTWRASVVSEVLNTVLPSIRLDRSHEPAYKSLKKSLPKHKMKYARGGMLALQFGNRPDMEAGRSQLSEAGIPSELDNDWAFRSITRDVDWGIPLPEDLDPELAGKTLYVWPDSLIAPISFSAVALQQQGRDPAELDAFWRDPDARVYQFLGQDNVFFYVLMQGAMWLGSQADPHRQPLPGELQLTDIFGCFHLLVSGEKMSKSRGNFLTADGLLERGYTADQVRYYLALLGLSRKQSNFDFESFEARNRFLAGPMNAAFEKPISAAHSQFGGRVPDGVLDDKAVAATVRMVQRYVSAMQKADYSSMLFDLENYARTINSQFAQHKPHDDRFPEEARRNALYTCFMVLKTLMIMLYPFTPSAMERLRGSLRLPVEVLSVDELGVPMVAGHELGELVGYYPAVADD